MKDTFALLEQVKPTTFAGRVGERFRVSSDLYPEAVELELIEVEVLPSRDPGRLVMLRAEPFALRFLGPAAHLLPQHTYRFEHGELGELEMFIVPVAQERRGLIYEAIFN